MPRYARVLPTHRVPLDPDGLELQLFWQRQVISRRQALWHRTEAALRHRPESGGRVRAAPRPRAGRSARPLLSTLFPAVRSDILTFYLP